MKHRTAVNLAITASNLDDIHRFLPVIALSKELARQMDDADPEPSARLIAAYLSVLKDLGKALAVAAAGADARDSAEATLQQLRTVKRIGTELRRPVVVHDA